MYIIYIYIINDHRITRFIGSSYFIAATQSFTWPTRGTIIRQLIELFQIPLNNAFAHRAHNTITRTEWRAGYLGDQVRTG